MILRKLHERSGTAAVELAVCLPFLFIVMAGIWEVGRMVQVQNLMANAAREGGRQAAAGLTSNAAVCQVVVNYLTMNGLSGISTSNVTLVNGTKSSRTDPRSCNQLDQWVLTVSVPYSSIRWSTIAQITPATTLTVTTYWYSMLDLPITISTTIPSN